MNAQFFRTAALVALIGTAEVAEAQVPRQDDHSANGVFSGCKAFVDGRAGNAQLDAMANFCSGVLHAIGGVGKLLPPEWRSCPPATSTAQQLGRVALQYIEANPQRMHEDFRKLAVEAFHQAWPRN
jgi:hypothetical protein